MEIGEHAAGKHWSELVLLCQNHFLHTYRFVDLGHWDSEEALNCQFCNDIQFVFNDF